MTLSNKHLCWAKKYNILRTIDILSLVCVNHYIVFRFFQNTMFQFVYSDLYKLLVFMSLGMMAACRIVYYLLFEGTRTIKKVCLFSVLFIPYIIVAIKNDNKALAFIPLCAFCLYKQDAERVCRWFVVSIGVSLAATMICAMSGCVTNIYSFGREGYRASFGINNTSDFAAYFIFLLLCIWCGFSLKGEQDHYFFVALSLGVAIGIYYFAGSRTALGCCILIAIAKVVEIIKKRTKTSSNYNKNISMLYCCAFPALGMLFFLTVLLYGKGVPFAQKLDMILSERLSITWAVLQKHGISIFGSNYKMHGWGGIQVRTEIPYDFLDSSYAYILIRYGIILTAIIVFFWVMTSYNAYKAGQNKILVSMSIIAIYGITEHHMVDVFYNIFLLMPLCEFETKRNYSLIGNKRLIKTLDLCLPVLLMCISCILLAIMLPWLRSFFYLLDWNKGTKAGYALVTILIIAVSVSLIMIEIADRNNLLKHKNNLFIAISLVSIVFVFLVINSQIENGRTKQKVLLQNERTTVDLIRESAQEPVYVFDKGELYNREYGWKGDFILTSEEIIRKRKGTIITSKNREIPLMGYYGGQYVEFSPNSGVYSFDENVIQALKKEGFEWKDYYSSERCYNLSDLALINGLTMENGNTLVLDGSNNGIRKNRYIDLRGGTYDIQILFSIDANNDIGDNNKLFTIELTANEGEELLFQKIISKDNLGGEEKEQKISITLSIKAAPKTELLMYPDENVKINIYKIQFKRVM